MSYYLYHYLGGVTVDEFTKQLGDRIRNLRLSSGMNQEELAFKSGISAAHLGQIERGLQSPTISTIQKIAKALNVTLPILFSFDLPTINVTSPELNKINSYLSGLSECDIKDISKIIKSIIHIKNS